MPVIRYERDTALGVWRCRAFGSAPDIPFVANRDHLTPGEYFPTAANTGVLRPPSELTPLAGNVIYSTNDAVIEDRLFLGNVSITGKRITFRNCWFRGAVGSSAGTYDTYLGGLAVCTNGNVENLLFEDCTFDPSYGAAGGPGTEEVYRTRFARDGIFGHHFTARRCRFAYTIDAVSIVTPDGGGLRADAVVEGCYLHDLTFYSPDTNSGNATHNDLIQWHGNKGVTLTGNRFEAFFNPNAGDASNDWNGTTGNQHYPEDHATSVVMFTKAGSRDAPDEFTFSKNWVNGGGAGFCVSGNTSAAMTGPNVISQNWFGWDYRNGDDFGILAKTTQALTISGNSRWRGTSWTHGEEASFEDGTWNPLDRSVSFNVRKNG